MKAVVWHGAEKISVDKQVGAARRHDPLGVDFLTTHRLPIDEAPAAYEKFRNKEDGCIKVVLEP